MKTLKNFECIMLFCLAAIVFNACSIKQIEKIEARKYGGSAYNHLAIQKKKDIQVTGEVIRATSPKTTVEESLTNSQDLTKSTKIKLSGLKGAASYGLTDNLALSGSINYFKKEQTVDINFARINGVRTPVNEYDVKARATNYNIALHYYIIDTIGSTKKWRFGQFYGAGLSAGNTITNGDMHRLTSESNERTWIRGVHSSNHYQPFLQSNYSFMSDILDVSFCNNISLLQYNLNAGQLSIAEKASAFFWQPSVRASIGSQTVKLFFQKDWTVPLNNQFFDNDKYRYYALGVQVKLNTNNF